MATRKSDAMQDMSFVLSAAKDMGELNGAMRAVLSELARLNGVLVEMNKEMDRKHDENQKIIKSNHEANQKLLAEHTNDDEVKFEKVFKWMYGIIGGATTITALWAVFKFVLPILLKVKLGD